MFPLAQFLVVWPRRAHRRLRQRHLHQQLEMERDPRVVQVPPELQPRRQRLLQLRLQTVLHRLWKKSEQPLLTLGDLKHVLLHLPIWLQREMPRQEDVVRM